MKKIIVLAIVSIAIISSNGCKSKCKGEDPRARIVNNGTETVSVQIQTSGGNTVNINNVLPSSKSDFSSYAGGSVTFTIHIGNKITDTLTVGMADCWEYDIRINADNSVVSVPNDRNE